MKTLTEKEIQDRLYGTYRSQDVAEEETVALKGVSSGVTPSLDEPRRVRIFQPKPTFLSQILPGLAAFSKMTAAGMWEMIRFLGSRTTAIFFALDFRKPALRRAAYSLSAVAFLAAMFVGIHLLNVQREIAMKAPRHQGMPSNASVIPPSGVSPSEVISPTPPKSLPSPASSESKGEGNKDSALTSGMPQAEMAASEPYVIQVATFASEADAKRLALRLEREGVGARVFVKALSRPGGKVYYCAFIGRFADYRDAERELSDFKKREVAKPFQDAFIRSLSD